MASISGVRVTTTEKRLVELYRAADADTKKKVLAMLRGNEPGIADLANLPSIDEVISILLGSALSNK